MGQNEDEDKVRARQEPRPPGGWLARGRAALCLQEAGAGGPLSKAARRRLPSLPGEPLFYSDWLRAVFIHYEVDAKRLQPFVPFPLDLRFGRAYVSTVAFTMQGLRPLIGWPDRSVVVCCYRHA